MLLGQGGMLSFGHAVYSGLGAFFAIHAMNLASGGQLPVPVTLIPLVGGLAGMFFGVLFGYVTTKKSGTTFAMITLGIVELVFACSLMFPGFLRRRGRHHHQPRDRRAVSRHQLRAADPGVLPDRVLAVRQHHRHVSRSRRRRSGGSSNAVRDNPERVEFIGYNTQWVRYLTLILSAFFAGYRGRAVGDQFRNRQC